MTRKVAVIVGSLRKDSFNRKLVDAIIAAAPAALEFTFPEIGDLPLFNQDLEATPPAAWTRFRDDVRGVDAVLWATPEYNRSMPAVIKNAVDVGSRPYGQSIWSGKPSAVVSATIGGLGGFNANQHLRQSLGVLNMPVMPQPEIYVSTAHNVFGADGAVQSESTAKLFRLFGEAFAAWIERNAPR